MQMYDIDMEESKKIYEDMKSDMKVKGCYDNIAKVVIKYIPRHANEYKDAKVVFGGWQLSAFGDNVFVRHCFLMTKDEKVIDPTYFVAPNEGGKYIKFFEYDIPKYLQLLENHNTSLDDLLFRPTNKIVQELMEKNIIVLG